MTASQNDPDDCLLSGENQFDLLEWDLPVRGHQLEEMPDEILLGVFNCVRIRDLVSLCIVSKKIGRSAQDVLYHTIVLSVPDLENKTRPRKACTPISRLLRTLIQRPELGHRTRCLRWWPQQDDVAYELNNFEGLATHALFALRKQARKTVLVPEVQLALTVLHLLPALEDVKFGIPPSSLRARIDDMSLGILYELGIQNVNISSIPCLKKIQCVQLQKTPFESLWFELPRLRHIVFFEEIQTDKFPVPKPDADINISKISFYLSIEYIKRISYWRISLLRHLFQVLPKLRELRILVLDRARNGQSYFKLADLGYETWSRLMDLVETGACALEKLTVEYAAEDLDWLSATRPISGLARLSRLRLLNIAYAMMPGIDFGKRWDPLIVSKMLPSTLELLRINGAPAAIFTWLEALLIESSGFPKLTVIELGAWRYWGDERGKWTWVGNLAEELRRQPVVKKLKDVGITVSAVEQYRC